MTQLQALTSESNIVVILPMDIASSGAVRIANPDRMTAAPKQARNFNFGGSAIPIAAIHMHGAIKEVEGLWRERITASREAKPVSYKALANAQQFLENIGLHTSESPDVTGFPNGEIGLEWFSDAGSLKVLIDDRNSYWFYESKHGRRRKGAEPWEATIPREVLDALHKLFA